MTEQTAQQERAANARKARRVKMLQRHADEWADNLRELGYTVTKPNPCCSTTFGAGHASICDNYGRES